MMVKYAELRELFTSLNDIFSKVFLLHSVVTLFYYVNTPAILTKMSLTRDKMYKIIYVAEHCLALGGASEIHKRVPHFITLRLITKVHKTSSDKLFFCYT